MSADQDMTRIDLAEAIARHAADGRQAAPADPEPTHRWAPQDRPADLLDPEPFRGGHSGRLRAPDLLRPSPGPVPQPCGCDECKYAQSPPGAGVVLYTGPDVTETLLNAAIRDGRYEDIEARFDDIEIAAESRFSAAERNAWRTIESGYRRAEAVLRGAA